MSQKDDIIRMLEAEKGYDEIEDNTGSQRSYIRSIAVEYRKRSTERETPETETRQEITPETEKSPEVGMNFIDDVEPQVEKTGKSGLDHHKAWVKAAKYECGKCGATVGRTSGFCPHCGETLLWEGIE